VSDTTIIYEAASGPRITLTKSGGGAFSAVVEVAGLNPVRSVSADERRAGVVALSPPTVRLPAIASAKEAHRQLIDVACRAVGSALASSDGADPSPGELVMVSLRVAFAMRGALRELGEDI